MTSARRLNGMMHACTCAAVGPASAGSHALGGALQQPRFGNHRALVHAAADFAACVKAESEKWSAVIRTRKLQLD
jgi:hypothetical protein